MSKMKKKYNTEENIQEGNNIALFVTLNENKTRVAEQQKYL